MFEQTAILGSVGEMIPIVAIGGGLLVGLVAIVGGLIHCHMGTRQREQTKREVAAYIAEGSMTPEEGERILAAGNHQA
ncbi:MAG: hypothetical protein RLN60_05110 [Phycisphaerales bacterium]